MCVCLGVFCNSWHREVRSSCVFDSHVLGDPLGVGKYDPDFQVLALNPFLQRWQSCPVVLCSH